MPNIDLYLVLLKLCSAIQDSKEELKYNSKNTPFSLFPLWAVILLYKEDSILARFGQAAKSSVVKTMA